jgi:hypothetical protein
MTTVAVKFSPEKLIPSRTGDLMLQSEDLTSLTFTKGVNFFQDYQVDQIKSHPAFIEYSKLGALQIVEDKPEEPLPLIKVKNAKDAILLIKTCHEIDQLKAWQQEEKEGQGRTTVLSAIDERLTILETERLTKATIFA